MQSVLVRVTANARLFVFFVMNVSGFRTQAWFWFFIVVRILQKLHIRSKNTCYQYFLKLTALITFSIDTAKYKKYESL